MPLRKLNFLSSFSGLEIFTIILRINKTTSNAIFMFRIIYSFCNEEIILVDNPPWTISHSKVLFLFSGFLFFSLLNKVFFFPCQHQEHIKNIFRICRFDIVVLMCKFSFYYSVTTHPSNFFCIFFFFCFTLALITEWSNI